MENLRVIVVDDSIIYRKIVPEVLSKIPGVEVVATAPNGKIGIEKTVRLSPDLITLDVEMPEMDGIETLRNLKERENDCDVVMLSSLTTDGAKATIKALELGAFDFITKPDYGSREENIEGIKRQIEPILSAISTRRMLRKAKKNGKLFLETQAVKKEKTVLPLRHTVKSKIVVVGVSTGGPNALLEVIPKLPKNLAVPVVIVQHMPSGFTASFAESLNRKSELTVVEAKDKQVLKPGIVYIAPGGKQMKIISAGSSSQKILKITDDLPENNCKPSVDYLFRSVAKQYRNTSFAVIMTGMGADGVLGLKLMKRYGVKVIAQSEETCVVFGMPGEALKAGVVDALVPLKMIANEIIKIV